MRVVIHRRAASYLKSLPQPLRERIKVALTELSESPREYPGLIQMAGEWAGYWRIRVGHIRIIYWFDDIQEVIYVDHIGARGDIYKR